MTGNGECVANGKPLNPEIIETKNLAVYKIPRVIEFVTELPKTISGKIRRVELRANEAKKKVQHQTGGNEYYFF